MRSITVFNQIILIKKAFFLLIFLFLIINGLGALSKKDFHNTFIAITTTSQKTNLKLKKARSGKSAARIINRYVFDMETYFKALSVFQKEHPDAINLDVSSQEFLEIFTQMEQAISGLSETFISISEHYKTDSTFIKAAFRLESIFSPEETSLEQSNQ